MNTILALETSCDETAVAILRCANGNSGAKLLTSEVASQVAEHEKYGGIVPEIASRNHLVNAPRLLERATRDAKIHLSAIDAFAATSGPGLATSLMVGASIAKGLAIGLSKPYLAINHLEGHLLSPFFGEEGVRRNVSLVVSGGHTMSILVRALADYQLIGRTVDDAAGEAFDKVARMLGLPYPGGPEIERVARAGDPMRFDLPRSMSDSENFSFSGLKTAVRYLLPKIVERFSETPDGEQRLTQTPYKLDERVLADLCASFQQAVVEVLVRKAITAARKYNADLVTMSGGVVCNRQLRQQMADACACEGFEFKSAGSWLCTDNAAMIAFTALLRLEAGLESQVTEEIDPSLALTL